MSIDMPDAEETTKSMSAAITALMDLIGDDPSLAHLKGIQAAIAEVSMPMREIIQNKETAIALAPYTACEAQVEAAKKKLWQLARAANPRPFEEPE